tara:strand:+ start:50 stop:1369 length:1320 start_codon:yes stop_codon:yes gene_type:complete
MNILDKTDLINNDEIKRVTKIIKQLFSENKYNRKELSKLFDRYLIPQESEKKNNAEVSTPHELRQEMLDKIPIKFWKNPGHKVFEPCCGKSGFLLDIIDRFMEGLKYFKPNKKERYEYIVTNCLYYADINPINIYISELLLNPNKNLKLNYHECNTLELNIKEIFGLDGFNAVIGNPPYNTKSKNKGTGHILWDKFVIKSIKEFLNKDGYLLFVHPSGWRQLNNKILNLLKTKQILYLEIHNLKDGIKTFKCSTRYDWYLLKNKKQYKKTIIKDEEYNIIKIDLSLWDYIPNMCFDLLYKITNNKNKIKLLHSESSYEPRKKWMSNEKNEEFKYECVYTINKKNILSLKYSKINTNGHFNITKLIFSNGSGLYLDINGDYGLTQWASAIVDDINILRNINELFKNNKFTKIIKAIQLNSSKYNIKVMKLFNKDFWKEFI